MRKKRLALLLVVVGVCVMVVGYSVKYVLIWDVPIKEVVSNPQSFDGMHLRLVGYIVKTTYMFGPKYVVRDFDNAVEVPLDGKRGPQNLDLEPYVSFFFDGKYTRIGNSKVSVMGYVRYTGWHTDTPPFLLDVEKVEPVASELETITMIF